VEGQFHYVFYCLPAELVDGRECPPVSLEGLPDCFYDFSVGELIVDAVACVLVGVHARMMKSSSSVMLTELI
jgi:hypothetical protein